MTVRCPRCEGRCYNEGMVKRFYCDLCGGRGYAYVNTMGHAKFLGALVLAGNAVLVEATDYIDRSWLERDAN